MANVTIDIDYRCAVIRISPGFFDPLSRAKNTEWLLHELIHILLAPMQEYALELLKKLLDKDTTAGEFLLAQYKRHVEQTTQDITHAFLASR